MSHFSRTGDEDVPIGSDFLWDATNNTLQLGEVGTEKTITISGVEYKSHLKVNEQEDSNLAMLQLHRHSTSDALGSVIVASRSNSSGVGHGVVTDGQTLLNIVGAGYSDDDYDIAAQIRIEADGNFAANDAAGRIVFFTTPSGSNVSAEAMRVSQDKSVSLQGVLILPKASTFGIKVDTATPTFGFADILGDQFSKNTGATRPTLTTYNGVINGWQFGVGDEAYISYHIPHDYVLGTPIFLHIHWSHIVTTVTGGTVTFKATSIYSKGHGQAAFGTPVVGTFTGTASTTQYMQVLSETLYSDSTPTGIQIDTDLLEPDGVIEMTFELDVNDITVSGGGVPDPFIHFVDLHYQTTGLIGTKAKAPDFYV